MIGEERPIGIKLTNPGSVDWYYGGGQNAYASIEDALTTVPIALRLGKTVGILIDGVIKEYWFASGTSDIDLVAKNSGGSGGGDSYTRAQADNRFQPIGDYLTGVTSSDVTGALGYVPLSGYTVDFSDYYTKEVSDAKYLTGFTVDLSNYYTKPQTDLGFQIKGNYLTGITSNQVTTALGYTPLSGYTVDLSNYYTKSQSDAKYLTGYTVDFSDYYNKSVSDTRFLTGLTKTQVTNALGYNPASGSTTLAGYGITSGDMLFDGKYLPLNTDLNTENQKALNLMTSPNKIQSFGASVYEMTTSATIVTQQFKTLALTPITSATTLYGVTFYQSVQGVYTANNENSISLYSYSNGVLTKVATTGNVPTLWSNSGNTFVNTYFTAPYNAAPGMYFLGMLYCASTTTTAPTIACAPTLLNAAMSNANLPNNTKLYGTILAQTSAASTINMSSVVGATARIWTAMF